MTDNLPPAGLSPSPLILMPVLPSPQGPGLRPQHCSMDPPEPTARGKDSSAGALPRAPDRRVGRTEVGVVRPGGRSSGALPWGVLAGGRPMWTELGSLRPPSSLRPLQAPIGPSRVLLRSGSPRASRPCPAARPMGAARLGPTLSFPLLPSLLEGPRLGKSPGTPSGHGAPSPQSPGSPVPQGSAGPHVCRTARHQAGDGTTVHGHVRPGACGLRETCGLCPRSAGHQCCSGLTPVPFAAAATVQTWPGPRLGTDTAGPSPAETWCTLSRPSPYRGGCAASPRSAWVWNRWRVRLFAPQADGDGDRSG